MLCGNNLLLKDPCQSPPFSNLSAKLLILHGKGKSYCLTKVVFLKVCKVIGDLHDGVI